MQKIKRNTLTDYIPDIFNVEENVNPLRIFDINNYSVKNGIIVYLCEREIRTADNFALQFAIQKSNELNLPLKVIHPKLNYDWPVKETFINEQISQAEKNFKNFNIDFEITKEKPENYLNKLKIALLVTDFNPVIKRNYVKNFNFKVVEIDGHNIVPARYISDKQEYNAGTFRKKVYLKIYPFLTEFKNTLFQHTEAYLALDDFIKNKLPYYSEFKNNPSLDILSGLSKYLNLGFISSQRIALEVIKSDTKIEDKEAFLEELIVRKELADNFCLYSNSYKNYSGSPNWAKTSLESHKQDFRQYIYDCEKLEQAETHDKLWNATQKQLIKDGKIHGYLRMYWAKKISEWTYNPQEAIDTAIYLNDKYAFDSPSPNGYVGILWAITGLHDRAFGDYPVTGEIRRMTYQSIKRKYNLDNYINTYLPYKL